MITLLRILFGFIVACLIAGVVTVAFVVTPADIANLPPEAQPERLGNAGILALFATHSAIFAFPFAIIAIGIAELSGVARGSTTRSSASRSRWVVSRPRISTRCPGEVVDPQWLCTGSLSRRGRGWRAGLLAGRRAPRGRQTWRRASASRGSRAAGQPIRSPRQPNPRTPDPPAHAQLCCCGAAISLAFMLIACGGKEKARRMIDPDLQQRFARRCTDAAFGYSTAGTAAYAAMADQVLNFW